MAEPKQENQNIEFKPVLSTYNIGDIAFIKSLLDCENINYYFNGENFNLMRLTVQPVVLMVQENQLEDTVNILKDTEIKFMLLSPERI